MSFIECETPDCHNRQVVAGLCIQCFKKSKTESSTRPKDPNLPHIPDKIELEQKAVTAADQMVCSNPECPPYKSGPRKGKKKKVFRNGLCRSCYVQRDRSQPHPGAKAYEPKIIFESTNPGQDRIDWIHANLKDAENPDKPFRFVDYQQDFIREAFEYSDVYNKKRRYNTAILTCGRKNGKSTGMAALGICEMRGPWAKPFDIPIASTTKDEAGTIYFQAKKIARNSGFLIETTNARIGIRGNDNEKILTDTKTHAKLKCLASDAKGTLSIIPGSLIFIDELGFHKDRSLYDSMNTSRAAHNPLMFIIGTRGPENSVFNHLIKTQENTPSKYRLLYQYVTEDGVDDPFDVATWHKANPGLGTISQLEVLEALAEEARGDEEALNTFKLLYLNMKMELVATSPFVDAATWIRCDNNADIDGPCIAGLDMGDTNDLTSLALYWPKTGRLWVRVYLPSAGDLKNREKKDGIEYTKMPSDIVVTAGKYSLDHKIVAKDIAEFHQKYGIEMLYADPNRMKQMAEKVDQYKLIWPKVEMINTGYLGMNPCIDMFEEKLRTGHIAHGGNQLLKRCLALTRISRDALRNRRFEKNRSSGRIDPVIASCLATGGMAPKIRESSTRKGNLADLYNKAPVGFSPRVLGA